MLDKKLRKQVESALCNYEHYKALKRKQAESLTDMAESGLTAQYGKVGGGGGAISNPTEAKALKAVVSHNAAAWCKVIERTKQHFAQDSLKLKFLEYRYFRNIPVLVLLRDYYKDFYTSEERTFYNWRDEILVYVALLATQEKLIKL